jgi:hypothetical protein
LRRCAAFSSGDSGMLISRPAIRVNPIVSSSGFSTY